MDIKMFLSVFAFLSTTLALQVTPGSPCTNVCQPNTTQTLPQDIACTDNQFNITGSVGGNFHDCVSCELQSDYANSTTLESDVGWGLFNLRYAFSSCVYGYPIQVSNISSPCVVSCTPISPALEIDLTSPNATTYNEFCSNSAFADNLVSTCEYCYALSSEQAYLANFLESVRYNCHFQTALGTAFAIAPTRIFNTTQLPTTTAAITSTATSSTTSSTVSNWLTIVIVVPIVAFLFLLAVLIFGCCCIVRRQRKKAKLRREARNIHAGWNSTVMSTPAIGGWSHPLTPYTPQMGMGSPGFNGGYEFQDLYSQRQDVKSGFSQHSSPVESPVPFPVQAHYYVPEKPASQEQPYFPPPPTKPTR